MLAGIFACFIYSVAATALTFKLDPQEESCFYTSTRKESEKIAFYFAVSCWCQCLNQCAHVG